MAVYQMPFVGKGKHFLVATTVAVGGNVVTASVEGECLADTSYFLCAITVGCAEAPGQTAVFLFYFCSQHLDFPNALCGEEGANPVVDAGTHYEDFLFVLDGPADKGNHIRTKKVAAFFGEVLAQQIEGACAHAAEEMGEDELLRFPVGIEVKFHQHQDGAVEQKAPQQAPCASFVTDNLQERVLGGECSVEVETIYSFFFLHII